MKSNNNNNNNNCKKQNLKQTLFENILQNSYLTTTSKYSENDLTLNSNDYLNFGKTIETSTFINNGSPYFPWYRGSRANFYREFSSNNDASNYLRPAYYSFFINHGKK